jgi:hypothetical protein
MHSPALIVGAGLAGLIAAHAWPQASVAEAQPEPRASHRALLRFRSDAVARLVGVEFKRVKVHKGIFLHGKFHGPDIQLANLYARKVTGSLLGDRSIWNIAPVERFVAPDTLYEQLVDNVGARIMWDTNAQFFTEGAPAPIISTAPLTETLHALGVTTDQRFTRKPILVQRMKVRNADVYQTVYFPDPDTQLYRASMTGDTLICEFAGMHEPPRGDSWGEQVHAAFGVEWDDVTPLERVEQRYGKIAPIDDAARRALLFKLTHEHGVYSLGRFATWRNILLDDVVNDIDVIKRLLRTADSYALRHSA